MSGVEVGSSIVISIYHEDVKHEVYPLVDDLGLGSRTGGGSSDEILDGKVY